MAKLGRPVKTERPKRYYELAEKVYAGEITERDAANELGMSREWFRILLKKDFPGRPKVNKHSEMMREVGKNNRKFTTYLESHFSDLDLCNILSMHGECSRKCPLYKACEGEHKCQGLVKAMLNKLPLKPAQNTLEET